MRRFRLPTTFRAVAAKQQIGLSGGAGVDLGLGLGGSLQQQVGDQTEELRKKKMREQQQAMSPAVQSLLGGMGGPAGY